MERIDIRKIYEQAKKAVADALSKVNMAGAPLGQTTKNIAESQKK